MPNSLAKISRNRWQILSALGSGHVQDLDVAGKRVRLSSQAPDMNIVNFAHARNFQHVRSPPVPDSMPLGRLSSRMFVDSVITPSAVHTIMPEIRNAMIGSINVWPVLWISQAPAMRARLESASPRLWMKTARRFKSLRPGCQHERDGSVNDERHDADHQHGLGGDRLRAHDSLVAFIADEDSHCHQQQGVHKGSQHTGALVAEGSLMIGRFAFKVEGDPGEDQGGKVGQVVPAIADQRQAVREMAGNELNHDQGQRNHQRALDNPVPPLKVAVTVPKTVAVAMTAAVHLTPAAILFHRGIRAQEVTSEGQESVRRQKVKG